MLPLILNFENHFPGSCRKGSEAVRNHTIGGYFKAVIEACMPDDIALRGFGITIALGLVLLTTGEAPLAGTTVNQVKSVDTAVLDQMMADKTYRGFVVFMAAWCPPCKEEMPVLADLYRRYQSRGIRIMAVSLDMDGPKDVQSLVNRLKIPFPVYWAGKAAVMKYRVVGIPMLMVIDRGKLVEKLPGAMPPRQLEAKLKSLLEK